MKMEHIKEVEPYWNTYIKPSAKELHRRRTGSSRMMVLLVSFHGDNFFEERENWTCTTMLSTASWVPFHITIPFSRGNSRRTTFPSGFSCSWVLHSPHHVFHSCWAPLVSSTYKAKPKLHLYLYICSFNLDILYLFYSYFEFEKVLKGFI